MHHFGHPDNLYIKTSLTQPPATGGHAWTNIVVGSHPPAPQATPLGSYASDGPRTITASAAIPTGSGCSGANAALWSYLCDTDHSMDLLVSTDEQGDYIDTTQTRSLDFWAAAPDNWELPQLRDTVTLVAGIACVGSYQATGSVTIDLDGYEIAAGNSVTSEGS